MCKIKRVYLGNKLKLISSSEEIFKLHYADLCSKYGEDNLRLESNTDSVNTDTCINLELRA